MTTESKYTQSPYLYNAGPLGHLEGVSVSKSSQPDQALCHAFMGLPYALPPTGPFRFRRPRPLPTEYRYGTQTNPGRFTNGTALCPQPKWRSETKKQLWSEDCLQLNIYIPAGESQSPRPLPVLFDMHGGWLQHGTANESPAAMTPLLSESPLRAIVVRPAYRLNVFGFAAGRELQAEAERDGEASGNMGFWDQRTALEWTARCIGAFGGDGKNITVSGYSAGSHSAFHQLAHELYFVKDEEAMIKRVIMWSNSPGVQPRTVSQNQEQFDELLAALKIPLSLPADEKLARLRAIPMQDLIPIQDHLSRSEFRATTDNAFVSKNLMININSGDFARRMKARNIKLMNGECQAEHFAYASWRTPANNFPALRRRLIADYPQPAVDALLNHYCGSAHTLPAGVTDWQDLFGRLYGNMQVHSLERGFHAALAHGGLKHGSDVLRYRIEWRAGCVDSRFPVEWGVTHATDMSIWFWGLDWGQGLTGAEMRVLEPLHGAFAAFVHGEEVRWGTEGVREVKRLRGDGEMDVWVDAEWDEGVRVWELVNGGMGKGGLVEWVKARI